MASKDSWVWPRGRDGLLLDSCPSPGSNTLHREENFLVLATRHGEASGRWQLQTPGHNFTSYYYDSFLSMT